MKKAFYAATLLALLSLPAFADSATSIPATPPSWPTFIRGGLIAAGLFLAANIAGRLWISWRQRQAERKD